MSVATLPRPTLTDTVLPAAHTHDRTCFWDVFECRWAGPAHPTPPRPATIPGPRPAAEA